MRAWNLVLHIYRRVSITLLTDIKSVTIKSIDGFERHILKRKFHPGTEHCKTAGLHMAMWGH